MALAKVEGSKVRNHAMQIKHYPRVAVISGCHIVFISRSERWRLEKILQDLTGAPILTVSDIPEFSQQGGMITLLTVDRRLRFAINPVAVSRAGLKLSSKLLELAQIVGNGLAHALICQTTADPQTDRDYPADDHGRGVVDGHRDCVQRGD